jgi:hypothetical protein
MRFFQMTISQMRLPDLSANESTYSALRGHCRPALTVPMIMKMVSRTVVPIGPYCKRKRAMAVVRALTGQALLGGHQASDLDH